MKKFFALGAYGAYCLFVVLFLLMTINFGYQVINFIDMDLCERLASIKSFLESFGF